MLIQGGRSRENTIASLSIETNGFLSLTSAPAALIDRRPAALIERARAIFLFHFTLTLAFFSRRRLVVSVGEARTRAAIVLQSCRKRSLTLWNATRR